MASLQFLFESLHFFDRAFAAMALSLGLLFAGLGTISWDSVLAAKAWGLRRLLLVFSSHRLSRTDLFSMGLWDLAVADLGEVYLVQGVAAWLQREIQKMCLRGLSEADSHDLDRWSGLISWLQDGVLLQPGVGEHRPAPSRNPRPPYVRRERRWFLKYILPDIKQDQGSSGGVETGTSRRRKSSTVGRRKAYPVCTPRASTCGQSGTPMSARSSRASTSGSGCVPKPLDVMPPVSLNLAAERRFTRSAVYKRHRHFELSGDAIGLLHSSSTSTLPKLRLSGSKGGYNKTIACIDLNVKLSHERSRDARGSAGEEGPFRHVCLFRALQSLGIPVVIDRSGPLRALRNGNEILSPHGYELKYVPYNRLKPGKYVKWHQNHFTAVDLEDNNVKVIDNGSPTNYRSVADLGRADEHLWYKLERIEIAGSDCGVEIVRLQSTRTLLENNRVRPCSISQTRYP